MRLSPALRAELAAMGESSYPHEGCGVLLGRFATGESAGEITEVRLGTNLRADRARDRYVLDPLDIIAAERHARETGLDVVGFWHTHPDHPSRPSQYDADHAWPDYVYLIMSVRLGTFADIAGWILATEDLESPRFRSEPLTD